MGRSKTLGALLAFVMVAGASRQAYAQSGTAPHTAPHVSIGGFWGSNVASVALSPSTGEVGSHQWMGGGATVNVPLAGILSIDARAMWNRKGARLPIAGTTAFQDVSADYLRRCADRFGCTGWAASNSPRGPKRESALS